MSPHSTPSIATLNAAHDFDFWMGHWKTENRKRARYLVGCEEWETFTATCHASALPAGIGNIDTFTPVAWRPGFIGLSLRLFNQETQAWSIYWLNTKNAGMHGETGHLETPVVGRFHNGVGTFTGREIFEATPIIVKFVWSNITERSARWHQEFSADDGLTWETNWVMQHTRVA